MRIKYNDKSDTFTEDHLSSKEPFGQFKAWFDVACNTPTILEPNAMLLGTATKFVLTPKFYHVLLNTSSIIIINRII